MASIYDAILQQMQSIAVTQEGYNAGAYNPNDVNPSFKGPGDPIWSGLAGSEAFYQPGLGYEGTPSLDRDAMFKFLADRGMQWKTGSIGNKTANWIEGPDGPIEGTVNYSEADDRAFMRAALAAMAVTGANVVGAGFGAGGAPGITPGGPAAPVGAQTFPVAPQAADVTTQLGNLASGATATQPQLTMAAMESGMGTPGYGYNASAAASGMYAPEAIGSGAGLMYGAGGAVVPYAASMVGNAAAAGAPGVAGAPGAPSAPGAPGVPGLPSGTTGTAGSFLDSLFSAQGLRSFTDLLSGLYGMNLAENMREQSDPFAKYREGYGEQLAQLEANPGLITQRPGWLAGTELINRQMGSRGYTGSGNEKAALQRYGGDFYNQEANRLATLAGAGQTPGAGQAAAANLASQSLGSIGYGIAPWLPNKP